MMEVHPLLFAFVTLVAYVGMGPTTIVCYIGIGGPAHLIERQMAVIRNLSWFGRFAAIGMLFCWPFILIGIAMDHE